MEEQLSETLEEPGGRWSTERAQAWHARQPWLVGANFLPSSAINQLEMWQEGTFDPERIDRELALAQGIGMNTMRVFLHDLLWQTPAFVQRLDEFLAIAERRGIKPMLVLFDSCWDPNPELGAQRAPRAGVHNSGWVQSPGLRALADESQHARLKAYVQGVVGAFAHDERILCWDIWNEPDNLNTASYADPEEKLAHVLPLLQQAFLWAREMGPVQPLTSGVWIGDWSSHQALAPIWRAQLENSDIISFHNYECAAEFEKRVQWLSRYGRPLLCTEYMARCNGSTFHEILPVMRRHKVAAYNWGFVAGKSQTSIPWDSWQDAYGEEPRLWFHDIFREDGSCYRPEETAFIREITMQETRDATGEIPAIGR